MRKPMKFWDGSSRMHHSNGPNELLTETRVCQPALYVHGFAVFSILKEQGKLDNVVAASGLSLGELTALASAEVFDFETGLKLVAKRGELMQEACDRTHGSMASVIGGSVEKVQELCDETDVEMANLNCPGQIVISGRKSKDHGSDRKSKAYGFQTGQRTQCRGCIPQSSDAICCR
jgi:[acyl-carrier-protein] S-malonyltransferase